MLVCTWRNSCWPTILFNVLNTKQMFKSNVANIDMTKWWNADIYCFVFYVHVHTCNADFVFRLTCFLVSRDLQWTSNTKTHGCVDMAKFQTSLIFTLEGRVVPGITCMALWGAQRMLGKNDGTFVQATGILLYILTVKKLQSHCVFLLQMH